MKFTRITGVAIAALLLAMQPALADPDKNESGHGRGKAEKHASKSDHKKKDHHEARFDRGGPPPWAPAHGYRRGQGGDNIQVASHRYDDDFEARVQADNARVSADIGISRGTCNRDTIGAVLGGVAGGVIGNRAAGEENRTAGTVAGVLIGGIVGHRIGRSMDNRDAQCTGQTLERVADRETVAWKNADNGQEYQVTPVRTYTKDGLYCREYVTRAAAGKQRDEATQNACRNPDGTWRALN